MNLATMLLRSARVFPHYPAVAIGLTKFRTYAVLAQRAIGLAEAMRKRVSYGGRVLLFSPNCPEYLEIMFACWYAGLVVVPVNPKLHPNEVEEIAFRAGARLRFKSGFDSPGIRIGSEEYEKMVATEPSGSMALAGPGVPAWMFFTSGTTGKPKGAVLTHGNLYAMCLAFLADVTDVDPGDNMIHAAPMSHGSGLYALPHVMKAACNVVLEAGKFDADEAAELLKNMPRSVTFGPPTVINRIVKRMEILKSEDDYGLIGANLKALIFGGSPLYRQDLNHAWDVANGRIVQIYGQGESPCTITAISQAMYAKAFAYGDEELLASVGPPQAGVEVSIGADSEVLVRGPQVMSGYWQDEAATLAAIGGGWLHTGDAGELNNGILTLKDRISGTIISGGSNIYPREIEEVLLKHPCVVEACVMGRAHADLGQQVVAVVVKDQRQPVAKDDMLQASLDELCLSNIARYKRPRAYFFLPALPVTEYGKVDRAALKKVIG